MYLKLVTYIHSRTSLRIEFFFQGANPQIDTSYPLTSSSPLPPSRYFPKPTQRSFTIAGALLLLFALPSAPLTPSPEPGVDPVVLGSILATELRPPMQPPSPVKFAAVGKPPTNSSRPQLSRAIPHRFCLSPFSFPCRPGPQAVEPVRHHHCPALSTPTCCCG